VQFKLTSIITLRNHKEVMGIINQISKVFSSPLKNNIMWGGYSSSNVANTRGGNLNSDGETSEDRKRLTYYYSKLAELENYEVTELTETIVGLYKDYLTDYMDIESNLIQLPEEYKDIEKKVNSVMQKVDLTGEILNNLTDIIYYGSHSFKLQYENEEWSKRSFYNNSKVTKLYRRVTKKFLVPTRQYTLREFNTDYISRIGGSDLKLSIDKDLTDFDQDDLYDETYALGGSPLYYNISDKVKEYMLKDALVSLLGIKDLIQPLLLLISTDRNTAQEDAVSLASDVEDLINNYSDVSSIISSKFSVSELVDTIINNVRVIPDYNNTINSNNLIDLSRLTDKISSIRGELSDLRDTILGSCAIPPELYKGSATKYEALVRSDRLKSRVGSYMDKIEYSIVDSFYSVSKVLGYDEDQLPKRREVSINLFTRTSLEVTNIKNNVDTIDQLLRSVNDIISNAVRSVGENHILDKEAYLIKVSSMINKLHPELSDIITEESINKYLQELSEGEDSEY